MIRGPVLPQAREALWRLLAGRLGMLETGLELVQEGLDCCSVADGGAVQVSLVDALARDALGAPVLLLVAIEHDPFLPGRIWNALTFLRRLGGELAAALPEAEFVPGLPGRVVVVGSAAALRNIDDLRAVAPASLACCQLEPFRLAGAERFAVLWLHRQAAASDVAAESAAADLAHAAAAALPPLELPTDLQPLWAVIEQFAGRLDAAVRLSGDRFSRRLTCGGRPLALVEYRAGQLVGVVAGNGAVALATTAEVRRFCDQVLRRYLAPASAQVAANGQAPETPLARGSLDQLRHGAGGLRAAIAGARLSAEEYAALGQPDEQTAPSGVGAPLAAAPPAKFD